MAQLKTYSRKAKLTDPFDGACKSSQESFFDSPDDPYFFDSQHSALDCSLPSRSTRSTLLRSSSVTSSGAACFTLSQSPLPTVLPAPSAVQTATSPAEQTRATSLPIQSGSAAPQSKQQCSKPLSRLSQSSSQSAGAKPASGLPAKQKRSLTVPQEVPASKKACLKHPSSSSVNQARSSGSRSGKDKDKQSSAPATTVLEAQESGEHTQIVDDIVYAVDGLGPSSSKNSWQDSASTLAEICNTRRGRQAFRIEGLFKEAVTAALLLPLHEECTTALSFAAMLLSFASGDVANRALLATTEAVQLVSQLLQVHTSIKMCLTAQAKLAKICRHGAMSTLVSRHPDPSPSLVVTSALSIALSPDKSSLAAEKLKENLRTEGALEQLVCSAQYHAAQEEQAATTSADAAMGDGVRAPTALNQCLTVLEHASFACPANEQHLVGLAMQPAADSSCQVPPQQHSNGNQSSAAQPFADWLVHQVQQMQLPDHSSQGDTLQPDWVCIQSALSVLINMTHNNQVGCQAVVTARGMQMAVCMISQSIQRQELGCKPTDHLATPGQVRRQDRQHVLTDVGPITAALGLLINLVEDCTESRQQMKSMRPAENGADTNMLELLCRLMQASASSRRSSMSPSPRLSSGEVTEQHLAEDEDDGAASIVEVYSALLFGFLLADDEAMQAAAVSKLGSLQPIILAIKKCLSFYVDAGAITTQNEESLRKLLASLPSCS